MLFGGFMPTYDYKCDANEQILEVKHKMSEVVENWGELCEKANIDPGNTPLDTPVKKLATGGQVVKSGNLGNADLPPCATGPCNSGMCGLN